VSIAIKVDKNARSDAEAKGRRVPARSRAFWSTSRMAADVRRFSSCAWRWRIGWGRLRSPGSKKGGRLEECVWLNVEERERGNDKTRRLFPAEKRGRSEFNPKATPFSFHFGIKHNAGEVKAKETQNTFSARSSHTALPNHILLTENAPGISIFLSKIRRGNRNGDFFRLYCCVLIASRGDLDGYILFWP